MRPFRHARIGAILACALNNADADYAGWAVGSLWGDGHATILRTTDSGVTWTRQGIGQVADVDMSGIVAVDPFTAWALGDSDSGYAAIYHTTDGGLTWDRKGSAVQLPDASLRKIGAFGDNKVWAVGLGAILHSSDGGATWTNQLPAGYESTPLQGVSSPDGVNVWVTGEHKDGYATILKSNDGGQSWTRQIGGDVASADHLLGVSAFDANTAWAVGGVGEYVVLHTTDGGTTWNRQSGVVGLYDANEVRALSGSTVWTACDNGVFWSTDGGQNWDGSGNHGFAIGPYAMDVSAVDSGQAWVVVHGNLDGSIWHTPNGGITWAQQGIPGATLPRMQTVSFAPTPIPEPSSAALLALASGLSGGRRCRVRSRHRTTPCT